MKNKSILNLGVRGFSLCARFLLSVFMLKYFPLSDIGMFGILVAVTSVSPAVLGFGVNYFFNRRIVVLEPPIAAQRVKERLLVSLCSSALISVMAFPVVLSMSGLTLESLALLGLVFVLETCLMDLHFSLLSMRKGILANVLLFCRSALWVYPFMLVAWGMPICRNFDSILWFWLLGQLISIPLAWSGLKGDPVRGCQPIINEIFRGRRGWQLIYVSDIGIAVMGFADRFILGSALDLRALGVYVFYATMANSVYLLLTASVTQMSLPDMLADGARSKLEAVMILIKKNCKKAISFGLPLSALVFWATLMVVDVFQKSEMRGNEALLAIILLTALIRVMADLVNQGLYALGADKAWAYINLGGAILSVGLGFPLAKIYGASGMAVGAMAAVTCVLAVRHWIILNKIKKIGAEVC